MFKPIGSAARGRSMAAAVMATALATGIATLATACSSQVAAQPHAVQVSFWSGLGSTPLQVVDAQTAAFNASQSSVHVTVTAFPGSTLLTTKVATAVGGGDPPVLSTCLPNTLEQFSQAGALVNMDSLIKASAPLPLFPSLITGGQIAGEQYGLPFDSEDWVLYYNKTMLAAAGITSPPRTWAQYATDVALVTKDGHWGSDFDPGDEGEYLYETMVVQNGGSIVNTSETEPAFDTQAGASTLQYWDQLVRKGYVHVGTQEYSDSTDFDAGKIAFLPTLDSALPYVQQGLKPGIKLGTAELPGNPALSGGERQGGFFCIFSHSTEQQQAGAFKYIEYMLGTSQVVSRTERASFLPTEASAVAQLQRNGWFKTNQPTLVASQALPDTFAAPYAKGWSQCENYISVEIDDSMNGSPSAQSALQSASRSCASAMTS